MGKFTISILAMAYFSPLSALILKHTGEEVVAEYRFHSGRDWRFDFAIPSRRVAVEAEGGAFNGGRHIRPEGYLRDTCVAGRTADAENVTAGYPCGTKS